MIFKKPIHQEYIEILNVHTPNNKTEKHVKQKVLELKEGTDKSIVIVGDFNTLLSTSDKTTKQKIFLI